MLADCVCTDWDRAGDIPAEVSRSFAIPISMESRPRGSAATGDHALAAEDLRRHRADRRQPGVGAFRVVTATLSRCAGRLTGRADTQPAKDQPSQ